MTSPHRNIVCHGNVRSIRASNSRHADPARGRHWVRQIHYSSLHVVQSFNSMGTLLVDRKSPQRPFKFPPAASELTYPVGTLDAHLILWPPGAGSPAQWRLGVQRVVCQDVGAAAGVADTVPHAVGHLADGGTRIGWLFRLVHTRRRWTDIPGR